MLHRKHFRAAGLLAAHSAARRLAVRPGLQFKRPSGRLFRDPVQARGRRRQSADGDRARGQEQQNDERDRIEHRSEDDPAEHRTRLGCAVNPFTTTDARARTSIHSQNALPCEAVCYFRLPPNGFRDVRHDQPSDACTLTSPFTGGLLKRSGAAPVPIDPGQATRRNPNENSAHAIASCKFCPAGAPLRFRS